MNAFAGPLLALLMMACSGSSAFGKNPVSLDLTNPSAGEHGVLKPYMISLRQRIQANWSARDHDGGTEYQARVRIIIGINGSIVNNAILESSGNPRFDQAVIGAIQSSRPFPQVPVSHLLVIIGTFSGHQPTAVLHPEERAPSGSQARQFQSPAYFGQEFQQKDEASSSSDQEKQSMDFSHDAMPLTREVVQSANTVSVSKSASVFQRVVPTTAVVSRKSAKVNSVSKQAPKVNKARTTRAPKELRVIHRKPKTDKLRAEEKPQTPPIMDLPGVPEK